MDIKQFEKEIPTRYLQAIRCSSLEDFDEKVKSAPWTREGIESLNAMFYSADHLSSAIHNEISTGFPKDSEDRNSAFQVNVTYRDRIKNSIFKKNRLISERLDREVFDPSPIPPDDTAIRWLESPERRTIFFHALGEAGIILSSPDDAEKHFPTFGEELKPGKLIRVNANATSCAIIEVLRESKMILRFKNMEEIIGAHFESKNGKPIRAAIYYRDKSRNYDEIKNNIAVILESAEKK